MAVTYPLAFPSIARFSSVRFDLVRTDIVTRFRSGDQQAAEVADALWSADFTSAKLMPGDHEEWSAWWASLRGRLGTFLAFDPSRRRPRMHPNGIAGWNGVGSVTGRGAFAIAVEGVPSTLQLRPGDYVGLQQGARRGLHRILAPASASGGGTIALDVEPAVLTSAFPVGATARFHDASCLMRLEPDSIEAPRTKNPPPVRFRGLQVL